MGVVYQAIDPTIGRSLAIKTIRLREVDDPDQRARLKERLFREARSAGLVNHPGIVTIYDMEEDDGLAYIAMQFVNGPTLDEVMSRPKPMAAKEVFSILRETAVALDFAHEKGIVHRDIKPANIMIDEHGHAKIADFGIAKVGTSGNLTLSGAILGTPNYMSPEQVQGKPVDGRADQFSLAVVAYEILTGERPFAGEHLGTVVYKIVAEEPPVAHRLNPSLSPGVDTVIRKALAKTPDQRYRSCTEFINALEGTCLQTEGWQSLARGTSHSIPTEASLVRTTRKRAAQAAPKGKKEQRERTSMFLPAAAGFLVVLGVLAIFAWQSGAWQAEPQTVSELKPSAPTQDPVPVPSDDVETPPPTPALPIETKEPTVDPTPVKEQPAKEKVAEPVPTVVRKPSPALPVVKGPLVTPQPGPFAGPAQDIIVQTNPAGATAELDSRPDTACQTPCTMLAPPGPHILSFSLANYQKEIRPFRVGSIREDIPMVMLHPNGGTLMVSTNPPDANIFIDGRLHGSLTPAQISLPPGSYKVMVERDGIRKTQPVEIRNGNTNYVRFILTP